MGTDDAPSDRRRAPRVTVNLPSRYHAGTVSLEGRALDLSETGMFFALPEAEQIFEGDPVPVEVEIDLLGTKLIVRGEVCWVDGAKPGLGIRFTDVSAEDRRRLTTLLGEEETKDGS